MKKIIVAVLSAALTISCNYLAFAQTLEEPVMTAGSVMNMNTYHLTTLEFGRDTNNSRAFLDKVNNTQEAYADTPADKIGIGILNTATSWTDIPREVGRTTGESNVLAGITVGLSEGIVSSVARGASGVIDATTFGLPPYNKPLMEPEYKVKNPEKDGLKVDLLKW